MDAGPHLSIKMRWQILRARFSTPALLTRFDERKVVSAITAIHGGLAILIIGASAWLTDLPLVFPALGPTAFLLFSSPMSPAGAPRSAIVGHISALLSGYAAWHLMTYLSGAPVTVQECGWPALCSSSLALAVTCMLLLRLSCPHAPACASALLAALGGITGWYELVVMAVSVILLTSHAVAMNRLAGVRVPLWHHRLIEPT